MPPIDRAQLAGIRGFGRLLVDGSSGVVDVVECMHRTIQQRPGPFGAPGEAATRGLTGQVYRSVRGTMRLVGRGLDASIGSVEGLLPASPSSPRFEAFASVLNGVYGDHLARTGNPLAIDMQFRAGIAGSVPGTVRDDGARRARRKLLVLVHGLCMSHQHWFSEGRSFGSALADELGFEPLYLRYNSGLPIAENGRRFAELLEARFGIEETPLDELVLLGHSMGGLVARSACLSASELGHRWIESLTRMVFLGTPHLGAPLERAGHGLDFLLELTPYSAPFTRLGRSRSAGIQDLRHGTVASMGRRFVPLPSGVDCYTMAATRATRRSPLHDRLVGDGLVPLHSALGRGRDAAHTLRFLPDRRWIGHGMGHLELLHRPEVYAQLHAWLSTSRRARASAD